MCGWRVSVDDVLQRHGTPSQTGPASTPEAIWDQQSSGGSLEKYQCIGAGVGSGTDSQPWIAPPISVAGEDGLLAVSHGDEHGVAPHDRSESNPDAVFSRCQGQSD